ncbi:MAG: nucleotidyl transferase AbiEii/AbiGii toxin family protein [Bacteroidota bacterium]
MKENYQPIFLNKITDDVVIEILNAIIPVFKKLKIDYFVVGAFARDVELLAKGHTDPPARKTRDLDLAVMLSSEDEFGRLKEKLTEIDGFEVHSTEPIKLIYDNRYELDLLPFGEIENEKGQVELKAKKTFTLDMPGFAEVYGSTNTIKTDQGFDIKVCSLPGVVLLKLIAWDDRKHRAKDIQDIEYIIRNLYLLEIDEIIETDDDLIDLFQDQNRNFNEYVTSRYIGRKIGTLIKGSEKIQSRVRAILTKNIQDTENSPMGKIMSFETLEESINIINQLQLGIEDILNNEGEES